jgi:hypothetical protein
MVAKLTVILFIALCLLLGLFLTFLPWFSLGVNDWGDNYLLAFVVEKTGWIILNEIVNSGWFRGAITGLGILNFFVAFWEIAHFNDSVRMLEEEDLRVSNER